MQESSIPPVILYYQLLSIKDVDINQVQGYYKALTKYYMNKTIHTGADYVEYYLCLRFWPLLEIPDLKPVREYIQQLDDVRKQSATEFMKSNGLI